MAGLDLRGRRRAPSKARKRRRTRQMLRIGVVAAVALALLGGVGYLSRLDALQVGAVSVEGNRTVSQSSLDALVEAELQGSYYFLLPRKNIFFYPKEGIEAAILSAFPIIRSASVDLKEFDRVHVFVEERSPEALWCPTRESAECYFVDEEGVAFTRAPEFSGTPFFVLYGGGISEALGKNIIPTPEYKALSLFLSRIPERALHPEEIAIESETYTIHLAEGGELRISKGADFSRVFENLVSAMQSEDFASHSLSDLDYIDLRFGNRVFFRFNE